MTFAPIKGCFDRLSLMIPCIMAEKLNDKNINNDIRNRFLDIYTPK